jgi:protein-tyrosine phosphatase
LKEGYKSMKNKHKSLIWLLLFLKLIVPLQKISCINMKSSNHTVLFICLGNICRSPAAEGIMKAKVEEKGLASQFYIDSAAIGPWHVGQLPDSRMRRCGAAHGYCFDSHARQFDKSDFAKFDYIVVMDNDNYRAITRMASSDEEREKVVCMASYLRQHRDYTTVPDPYYGDESDFELVITLLEDALEGLIEEIITR